MWALTPQNEPGHAEHARWDTCFWSAEWQREFVADYLGPALAAAGLLEPDDLEAGLRLFVFDHNKADALATVPVILDDPDAARYVRGIAIHWYAINLGGTADYRARVLDELGRRYPDQAILHTESSIDLHPEDPVGQYWDPDNVDWTRGRFTPFSQYAIDIITDLNHGAIGYIEWCMVLSTGGGPNPYDNFNSAPVLVDPRTRHRALHAAVLPARPFQPVHPARCGEAGHRRRLAGRRPRHGGPQSRTARSPWSCSTTIRSRRRSRSRCRGRRCRA